VKRAAPEDRLILERLAASEGPSEDDLAALRGLVERYESVPATMRLVDEYLARARAELSLVSNSPACHTLHRLVDFVRERDW
jgi:geranylgeranyl pyrophosphate synthase